MGNNHTFRVGESYRYDGANFNGASISDDSIYTVFTWGDWNLRMGIRGAFFVVDLELFEYGFSAAQNVGWINLWSFEV
jgi:hypothetical protein